MRNPLRGLKAQLGIVNDDPTKGPVRFRAVYPTLQATPAQGLRERRRRVKQIVLGTIPAAQLGGDRLAEYHLAKRNYVPVRLLVR